MDIKSDSVARRIEAARAARLAQTEVSSRALLVRCWAGEASPRQAIKAFCVACVGGTRAEVTRCTCYACPLYEFRPFKTAREDGILELKAPEADPGMAE
ncbi:hypothetical protein [Cupriavidus metallidurans]|uniref:Uncharacterized protein n=1 Tax=Cupriavidus metallidurans (strain ATCC 43123 / DSM 2839 / NBRC 102507 / CH34) TaxID=266264 RepID=Q1LLT3_CUPMC|nr:hypothetical protein [Cupriavidus metallidurans]ABF08893.1 hypothetical protein Rmet_2014 [Cupriavidus metallidurans CH34]QGS30205.1 hypothetical protein FOB83_15650 [Cupriavidus metallidurans]